MMVRGEGDDVGINGYGELEPEYFETITEEAQRYLLPLFKFNQS